MLVKKKSTKKYDRTVLVLGDSFAFGHGCSDRFYFTDEEGKAHGTEFDFRYPSEFCYASLIAKNNTNWKVINKSSPGLDNLSMFQELLKLRKDSVEIDYVFVAFSFDDRMLVRDPRLEEDKSKFLSWPRFGHKPKKDEDHIFGYPDPMVFRMASSNNEIPQTGDEEHHKALIAYRNELFNPRIANLISLSLAHAFYSICLTNGIEYNWSASSNSSLSNNRMYDHMSNTIRDREVPGMVQHLKLTNTPPYSKYRALDGHANDLGHSKYYTEVIEPLIKKFK